MTGLFLMLQQPYSEALAIPGDMILEIVESKLDEGLAHLEGEGPRLARKQIQIVREFGSVRAFVAEAMKAKRAAPQLAL